MAITPGTYVQINPANDPLRAAKPGAEEKGLGIIKQAFTAEGDQYYVVVWNPGDAFPKTGTYRESQLTQLSPQDVQKIKQEMASGTYSPSLPEPGSNYKEPPPPAQALPQTQTPGQYSL